MGKTWLSVILIITAFVTVSCGGKFACKETLGGTKCESLSEVYEEQVINRGETVTIETAKDKKGQQEKPAARQGEKGVSGRGSNGPEKSEIVRHLEIDGRQALKVPLKVVRIWVAPWEDEDGDLHESEFIYTEVGPKGGRWAIGEKAGESKNPVLKRIDDIKEKPAGAKESREDAKERSEREKKEKAEKAKASQLEKPYDKQFDKQVQRPGAFNQPYGQDQGGPQN